VKRISKASAIVVGLSLTLMGCSGGGSSGTASGGGGVPQATGQPDKLTILVTNTPSATALQAVAKDYTAKTGIKIEFVVVPYAQIPTKVILAKQSNSATFDIAQIDGVNLPTLVQTGALLSLDSHIDADKTYNKADFSQQLLDYGKQDNASYALPLSTEPTLQFYRTDLYDQAGLKPATTWQELIADAPKLQAPGEYPMAMVYGLSSAKDYAEMLYTSGGRMFDPKTYKPLLDTAYAKQIMQQYLDLSKYTPASSATGGYAEMATAFSQLNVAQIYAPSGWFSTINNPSQSKVVGKFSTAPPPMTDAGPYSPQNLLYGWLIGISSVSPHQQAAWDFLSYVLSPANVQAFVDAGAPPPARISTTKNPDLVAKLPYLSVVQDAMKEGTVLPRIPELTQCILILSQAISSMESGQVSVDNGMTKANSDITDVLVQAGRYKG